MSKTFYGLNPSFASWALGRLPLFADPIRRGIEFEVFREDGTPTGEPSPLAEDGWPIRDDRWHGVRLFGDMGGTMPKIESAHASVRANEGNSAFVFWKFDGVIRRDVVSHLRPSAGGWHLPSLKALDYFKPKVLRTLDWSYQARRSKRPDWTKPRVIPSDPLQGAEMAVELQCQAANALKCALWWNAPPRFELSVPEYERRLEEMLTIIRDTAKKPPILEYGNELWNEGFPVKNWLDSWTPLSSLPTWHARAAYEIETLKRVADRVFGEPGLLGQRPCYLFVGGHIGDQSILDKILGYLDFTPDIAGPAIYAQPRKADQERWKTATELPQEELRASVLGNMSIFRVKLAEHRSVLQTHGVPYFACYEVGQDMHARGDAYKKAALQAQREEWMGEAYTAVREMLTAAKVNLACFYSCASAQTLDRSFGLLESCDLTRALPKAKAARGEA